MSDRNRVTSPAPLPFSYRTQEESIWPRTGDSVRRRLDRVYGRETGSLCLSHHWVHGGNRQADFLPAEYDALNVDFRARSAARVR